MQVVIGAWIWSVGNSKKVAGLLSLTYASLFRPSGHVLRNRLVGVVPVPVRLCADWRALSCCGRLGDRLLGIAGDRSGRVAAPYVWVGLMAGSSGCSARGTIVACSDGVLFACSCVSAPGAEIEASGLLPLPGWASGVRGGGSACVGGSCNVSGSSPSACI